MDQYVQRDRNYDVGRLLLTLRSKIRCTQTELAALARVSRRSIQIWEGGEGYPKEDSLQRLIAVFLERRAFGSGQERAEAEALWELVDQHAPQRLALFDGPWFDQLALSLTAPAVAPAGADVVVASNAQPGDAERGDLPRLDWGEASDVPALYGREADLARLDQWVIGSQARVVALLGMGGIGKTSLAVAFTRQVAEHFEVVIFRSLRNAPPLAALIDGVIRFLANDQHAILPQGVPDKFTLLLALLRERRCLLVLDNLETIMQEGLQAGLFRPGYADYGALIQQLGEAAHRSCLLLTSREKPRELGPLESEGSPTYTLPLSGLGGEACRDILHDRSLRGSDAVWVSLTQRYGGNPLALKLVSEPIREIFGGDIDEFLQSEQAMFGGIRYLLDQQFQRLSAVEQDLIYWLAMSREPVGLATLRAQSTLTAGPRERLEAIEALRRRFLIERREDAALFSLQPVILEYVTEHLIEQFQRAIVTAELDALCSHALFLAQAPAYVRQSQIRLIIQPLLARLLSSLKSVQNVEQAFGTLLAHARGLPMAEQGYSGGNILNLLIHLGRPLQGYNFAGMNIWQAYLADVELHQVDFSGSDLSGALFTETFKTIVPVAFSPDGAYLAAGSVNGEIWLWRVADRQQLGLLTGHDGPVNGLAWSPNGQFLASAGSDGLVALWAAQNGVRLSTFDDHTARVWSVAFSPDGSMLASGSDDQTIRIWSVATGEAAHTLSGHQAPVASVAWSPDGSALASASHGPAPVLKLWSAATGANTATLTGHSADIWAVLWSPDGRTLASGSADRTLKLWSADDGAVIATLTGHTARIRSVAWSPDGKLLASGSLDQTTKIWDAATYECLTTLAENTGPVNGVAWAPDSDLVASGGELQMIVLSSAARQEALATLQGYNNGILSMAFAAGGATLASAGFDRTIRLWSTDDHQAVGYLDGHTAVVYSLAFNGDGTMLASGSGGFDCTVRLWSVGSAASLATFREHGSPVMAVAWGRSGRILASGSLDCTIKLWSSTSTFSLATLRGHDDAVRAIAFDASGQLLASGSYDHSVRIWSIEQRMEVGLLTGHVAPVRVVAWASHAQIVASGSADHSVRVWDAASKRQIALLAGHDGEVPALAWHPDGSLLASGSFDGTIRIWDVATWAVRAILRPEAGIVYALAWSPDGGLLASGGADGVVRLWSLNASSPVATLHSRGPYTGMRINGTLGLTDAQRATLRALGAVEELSL